jgi:hypothetical protein
MLDLQYILKITAGEISIGMPPCHARLSLSPLSHAWHQYQAGNGLVASKLREEVGIATPRTGEPPKDLIKIDQLRVNIRVKLRLTGQAAKR